MFPFLHFQIVSGHKMSQEIQVRSYFGEAKYSLIDIHIVFDQ